MGKKPSRRMRSNSDVGDGGTRKRFTKKELEEAYCKRNSLAETANPLRQRRTRQRPPQGKNRDGVQVQGSLADQDLGNKVHVLDAGVKLCARKLNECRAKANRLEEELRKKHNELRGLSCEAEALEDMKSGNNPEARRINELAKEIEKVTKGSERKTHYKIQLNHMNQRLRKNSVSLDGHVRALSETVSAAEKDLKKCEKMMGEVQSSHKTAAKDLETAKIEVEVEKAERQTALDGRRSEADHAARMEAWRIEREGSRTERKKSFVGSRKHEKEKRLRVLKERSDELKGIRASSESKTATFANMEESFKHIKQATGVNSLAEMVEKFTNHQEQRDRQLVEKKEAEDTSCAAKKSLEDAQEVFNRAQANGFGDTELSRDLIDEIQDTITREKAEGKVIKSTNARLEGVLVGLRQGGLSLYQRLLPYRSTLLDGEAPKLSESATTRAVQAYDTLEMLRVTDQILENMLDAFGGLEEVPTRTPTAGENSDVQDTARPGGKDVSRRKVSIDTSGNPSFRTNNCRIVGPRRSDDSDTDDRSVARSYCSDDSDASAGGGASILSRKFLKKSSEKKAEEARRRKELAERRRLYKEKASMNADDADDVSDANEGFERGVAAMLRKRQLEVDTRMAQHSLPVGLPKNLSIRDDPMTKAQVFLTESPELE